MKHAFSIFFPFGVASIINAGKFVMVHTLSAVAGPWFLVVSVQKLGSTKEEAAEGEQAESP